MLPQAIANGRNQNGTIAGKLKGTIAAQTPTGWRTVSASIPRETSSAIRPWIVVGIAQAASTISIIRATSARASPIVLPISAVTDWARSSRRRIEPLAQREEPAAALDHADLAPLGQRRAGGLDGAVEVGGGRERHLGERLAGGGVGDVEVLVAGARHPGTADEVVQQSHGPSILVGARRLVAGVSKPCSTRAPSRLLMTFVALWVTKVMRAAARPPARLRSLA